MATIKVYGRVAPCSNLTNLVEIQGDRLVTSKLGRRNSKKNATEFGFAFTEIFNQDASQGEVFDVVAKDLIGKFIDGYNGTIFAYGQTGTGKTYTIEGEDLNFDTSPRHGLISQALTMIFNEIEKMKSECVTVQISYLEMYNETAYDLLGPLMYGNSNRRDLPKVLVTQGTSESCIMHGLSVHNICTEHHARRLHLKGRCNRTVAWSSSNERSSRSHCIFTVFLTRQKQDSEIIIKSKLNLVDLAGSEKISSSGTEGQTQYETKCINLSLHYLETVILALQRLHVHGTRLSKTSSRDELKLKRCKSAIIPEHKTLNNSFNSAGWSHLNSAQSTLNVAEVTRKGISLNSVSSYIPYRNSLLTMILKDSLGGNCNTTMIATLSLDTNDLNETVSTCRFAQRVARITNDPVQNKEINEAILIKKLKSQVAKLMKDLDTVQHNKNEQRNSPGEEPETAVIEVVDGYIEGRIDDPTACGIDNPQRVRACLAYLKRLLVHKTTRPPDEPTSSDEKDSGVGMNYDPCPSISNTNEEPSSPSTATDSGGGTSEESIPSPPPITKGEFVKKHCRDAQLRTSSFNSQTFFPQSITSETTSFPSGTQMNEVQKSGNTGDRILEESQKRLLLMELEIKKTSLSQKRKLLSTAVSNQKARVVFMEKHGCPIDELANERLAEQQLRKKQAEVERNLSKAINEILETKATNYVSTSVSHDKTAYQDDDISGIQGEDTEGLDESRIDSQLYYRRKLELKERSTRLRLLTCRQKLNRGLISTGSPETFISKETISNRSELCIDKKHARDTSPLDSPDESVSSKQLGRPSDAIPCSRLPSARAQSSFGRIGTLTENKRKSKNGIFRSSLSKQSRGLQANSTITGWKSHMSKPPHASASNGRTSRHFRLSPSNSQSNTISWGNQGEYKAYGKSADRTRRIRAVGNHDALQRIEGVADEPTCVRSRRPAMFSPAMCSPAMCSTALCSPALVTNKRSIKRATRPSSINVHYQYDQSKGFIVRTNEDVYRASNFQPPVPQALDEQNLYIKTLNVSEETSPKSSPRRTNEQGLEHSDVVTAISRGRTELPAIAPIEISKEEAESTGAHYKTRRTQIDSEIPQNIRDLKGPQYEKPKQPLNDDGPKRDLITQRVVPQTIISARKQQIERARRIRLVTNAVEVIQEAYRRYLWRRTNEIQPGNG